MDDMASPVEKIFEKKNGSIHNFFTDFIRIRGVFNWLATKL